MAIQGQQLPTTPYQGPTHHPLPRHKKDATLVVQLYTPSVPSTVDWIVPPAQENLLLFANRKEYTASDTTTQRLGNPGATPRG
ncbi:Uu.00g010930.m01.CDS01 [Anthostomella pinea]|uniref:Uu.00g010930.m01.CDS01 n=1 Tax=Anthostomella pinea TaxID=933095 RepID=A0AAI8VYC3_9PEZI|nr:Uu.00g010930.m01.CDS01 [Anthostomella pinea]